MPILDRRRLVKFLAAMVALSSAPVAAQGNAPTLLVVGDSISAGYGLAPGEGWVSLLAARIAEERFAYKVVNGSISGDTTAGGRARLPALLMEHRPAIVVIELGGNDALRGQPLAQTRANLDAMVKDSQAAGAKVLLLGMKLPPNYGSRYVNDFDAAFAEVAKARRVAFVPYLFDGFGENLELFQPDRIHPAAAAQPRLLANVWTALKPLLSQRLR